MTFISQKKNQGPFPDKMQDCRIPPEEDLRPKSELFDEEGFRSKIIVHDPDQINPHHYGGEDNPYEAIKVIEAWDLNFSLGNTIKYICRAGKKTEDSLVDLLKAKRYLEYEIARIERLKKTQ
jgi:hypothetical protein